MFQIGERVDDGRGFEDTVPFADLHLGQHSGQYEPLDGLAGLRKATADQAGGAAHSEHGCAGQGPEQQIDGGPTADTPQQRAPLTHDLLDTQLE